MEKDVRLSTRIVMILYRSESLPTVPRELERYKSGLGGVQKLDGTKGALQE